MNGHRYNTCFIPKPNTDQRILNVMKDHEQVRSETIGKRVGVCRGTVSFHLRRLIDAGMVVMARRNGHPVYAKTTAVHVPRRPASVQFAGRVTIGRGLAGW